MTIFVVDLTIPKRENQHKNRQVTFQIDWISNQKENFLVDSRNCQNESKTCQLFFSVYTHRKISPFISQYYSEK